MEGGRPGSVGDESEREWKVSWMEKCGGEQLARGGRCAQDCVHCVLISVEADGKHEKRCGSRPRYPDVMEAEPTFVIRFTQLHNPGRSHSIPVF